MSHLTLSKNTLMRSGFTLAILMLLFLAPLYLIHAQSLTFTTDPGGNWQFSSGYTGNVFTTYVTSTGRGSSGLQPATNDTSVPSTATIEVFVANTTSFSNPCSSAHYTGNPTSNFACLAAAATKQGYAYVLGQAPQAAPVGPKPCTCP